MVMPRVHEALDRLVLERDLGLPGVERPDDAGDRVALRAGGRGPRLRASAARREPGDERRDSPSSTARGGDAAPRSQYAVDPGSDSDPGSDGRISVIKEPQRSATSRRSPSRRPRRRGRGPIRTALTSQTPLAADRASRRRGRPCGRGTLVGLGLVHRDDERAREPACLRRASCTGSFAGDGAPRVGPRQDLERQAERAVEVLRARRGRSRRARDQQRLDQREKTSRPGFPLSPRARALSRRRSRPSSARYFSNWPASSVTGVRSLR